MAVMATSRSIKHDKNNNKKKPLLHTNVYDGYAIYSDQDRERVTNFLEILNHLKFLRVRCKEDAKLGEPFLEATIENGIWASKYCLFFVSSHFKSDPFCKHFTWAALFRYIKTFGKLRIITISLDHTKIPLLEMFKDISINKFSCGTERDIVVDEILLCNITKAIVAPQLKQIHNSWKGFHTHVPTSKKRRKDRKLLRTIKKSKFLRFLISINHRPRRINLGYAISKCFLNSFLWKKLTKLFSRRQRNISTHIDHHPSRCKYCKSLVFSSELKDHEDECSRPVTCGSCGRLISRARQRQHEIQCIFEECSKCDNFHSCLHDCPENDSLPTGRFEDAEVSLEVDFASLTSAVSPNYMEQPEMKKTMDKLMKLVETSLPNKKNKKPIKDPCDELTSLIYKLLEQLKCHKIIDQRVHDDILERLESDQVSFVYSAKSINYFRSFVFAVELHCCDISFFKGEPLVERVMSGIQSEPQPKLSFRQKILRRLFPQNRDKKKEKKEEEQQVFAPLAQGLYKI